MHFNSINDFFLNHCRTNFCHLVLKTMAEVDQTFKIIFQDHVLQRAHMLETMKHVS